MSKIIKSFFSFLFLISFTASVSAADYNLRMTMNSNDQDEDYDGAVVFKNYVEAASNGKIAVELFVGTQLCSKGAECLQGVSDGSIDIYISTSGGAAGVFPYVQVLDLPYLMADDRIAEDVMQGDFVRTMRKMALKDSNDSIRLMTIGNTGGWRNFANTKRRIANPSDMKGLKIRTVVADALTISISFFISFIAKEFPRIICSIACIYLSAFLSIFLLTLSCRLKKYRRKVKFLNIFFF